MVVATPPIKTNYLSGTSFDKTGMTIIGVYGIDDVIFEDITLDVTNLVDITPEILTDDITEIKISILGENGKQVFLTYPITVSPVLVDISFEIPEKEYEYKETFPNVYPIKAIYSDGHEKEVTALCSNTNLNTVGQHNIILEYTENYNEHNTIKQCIKTLQIDVKRKSIVKPTRNTTPIIYNKNNYNIASSTYINDYNESYYTVTNNIANSVGEYIA